MNTIYIVWYQPSKDSSFKDSEGWPASSWEKSEFLAFISEEAASKELKEAYRDSKYGRFYIRAFTSSDAA
jgi:hypothetical protein